VSRRTLDSIDGMPLVAGLACLLKQMHPSVTTKLMSYLGQYVRAQIQQVFGDSDVDQTRDKALEIPPLVVTILIFLDQLCRFSSIPRSAVHAYVPPYIFDSLNIPCTK
jgi:Hereditary spastic paraplegia protein strumpellin